MHLENCLINVKINFLVFFNKKISESSSNNSSGRRMAQQHRRDDQASTALTRRAHCNFMFVLLFYATGQNRTKSADGDTNPFVCVESRGHLRSLSYAGTVPGLRL